ncbi:quinone oxidoreductase-like protein 1 isoform X1 [Hydra vulgaris]|uniref:quinone oxidoreductase-like protein 1 isoform X1 n=1 Tax=Hydra vulgaris TaxID=6087 RepID=UPI0006417EB1|nr:quinone oxidoreductase-like protein 1 isoform X1 [Hydra vulgaris]
MLIKKVVVKHTKEKNEFVMEEELTKIDLGEHEVLVKILCCSVSSVSDQVLKRWHSHGNEEFIYPFGREISGLVQAVGSCVTLCKLESNVAGVIPLDSTYSGCANFCVMSEFDLVQKPESVSHLDASCSIGDGVKAYTALFYQAKLLSNETILIFGASKGYGILAVQLAKSLRAKVIVIGASDEEMEFFKSMQPKPDCIIDMRTKNCDLINICMEETGGIGIDCIIDDGVEMYSDEFKEAKTAFKFLPSKHELITCLAAGGRWITTQSDLQVDPPDSETLFLKCASIHFLFEDVWTLSRSAQGKYLHILNDIMAKVEAGTLRPTVHHTVFLDDCVDNLPHILDSTIGKVVIKI